MTHAEALVGSYCAYQGAAGCRAPTLLGVGGSKGRYPTVIDKYLTSAARVKYFGESNRREKDWMVLAQNKAGWRNFVRSVCN